MGEQAVVYYQFKGLGNIFAEIEKTPRMFVLQNFIKPEKIGVIIVSFNTTSKQDKNTTLRTFANIILHMSRENRKPRSWVSWRNT